LPKREALGLLVPGLFGYRCDTPNGGEYWGAAGRDAAWVRFLEAGGKGEAPKGIIRFTGGGNYTGVLVVLVGVWAACQALRGQKSVFSLGKRRWILFWIGQAVVSLLLAFGKFAPFYGLVYVLPFASTMRNPAKFIHPVNFALVVLFAYGVHGLWKFFLEKPESGPQGAFEKLRVWWKESRGFDRGWAVGCIAAVVAAATAWFAYSGNAEALQSYLHEVRFDAATAQAIANFSITQVGWFVVAFTVAVLLLLLVLSGTLNGKRAGWAGIALGLFLLLDFGRANTPWIVDWNYRDKYASNPIIDKLRTDANQHRVTVLPFLSGPQDELLDRVYHVEWAQHQFQRYDIQSLDIVQMSRVPEDLAAFDHALEFDWNSATIYRLPRCWQLTNTRYLLGAAALLDVLNREIDPVQHRFSVVSRFNLVPKVAGAAPLQSDKFAAVPAADGQYALFDFGGALPRARLFTNWQVETNTTAALAKVTAPAFEPEKIVMVGNPIAAPPAQGMENQAAGTVRFERYSPKNFVLSAEAKAPSVLLLNDRFDPNWEVLVDGKKDTVLRCNQLMRGVYLQPGTHRVEFIFRPPIGLLHVSIAAIGGALCLLGFLCLTELRKPGMAPAMEPRQKGRTIPKNAQLRPT
jgi:hypothetical protein